MDEQNDDRAVMCSEDPEDEEVKAFIEYVREEFGE